MSTMEERIAAAAERFFSADPATDKVAESARACALEAGGEMQAIVLLTLDGVMKLGANVIELVPTKDPIDAWYTFSAAIIAMGQEAAKMHLEANPPEKHDIKGWK